MKNETEVRRRTAPRFHVFSVNRGGVLGARTVRPVDPVTAKNLQGLLMLRGYVSVIAIARRDSKDPKRLEDLGFLVVPDAVHIGRAAEHQPAVN